jgi:signal transduction histidine kinase
VLLVKTRAHLMDHSVLVRAEQAVGRVLAQRSGQQRAYRRVLEAICVTLDWQFGAVWEVSDDETLRCVVTWSADGVDGEDLENATRGVVLARGEELPGRVWNRGRPAGIREVAVAGFARRAAAESAGVRSAYGFTVRGERRILAVIELFACEPRSPDAAVQATLTNLGRHLGQYVERRRAQQDLVDHDARSRVAEEELRALAQEQAALRRVAMLVAAEGDTRSVFSAVTEEVGRLLGAHTANMIRFEDGPWAVVAGGWSAAGVPNVEVDSIVPLDGETTAARVWRTGRPARLDSYDGLTGELAEHLRSLGFRSAVGAPIFLGGRLWGAVLVSSVDAEPFAVGAEARITTFAELVAQALANAEAREQLAGSRARIVQAADTERRRLERNLHDGAQQRLVGVSLALRLAERQLAAEPAVVGRLAAAREELDEAMAELRELARGLHPAILTDRGLNPALDALAARAPVPVELTVDPNGRLPEPVEAAAYYVVAEALTNVAKYASATVVNVKVEHSRGQVLLTVCDDGIGGANAAQGSGLRGLSDRVEAIGGEMEISSPRGVGTTLRARMPCEVR